MGVMTQNMEEMRRPRVEGEILSKMGGKCSVKNRNSLVDEFVNSRNPPKFRTGCHVRHV